MTDKPITYAMLRFADATEIMIEFSVGQHLDQALAELRLAATGDTAMHQASDTGDDDAESLARFFHETYERLAPDFSYETRKASAVPWEQVPDNNRRLMIAVAAAVLDHLQAKAHEGNG
jgi:hypothetical protein